MHQSKFLFIESRCVFSLGGNLSKASSLEDYSLERGIFVALTSLKKQNFEIVILDSQSTPKGPKEYLAKLFNSQDIEFYDFISCDSNLQGKASTNQFFEGALHSYLIEQMIDRRHSAIIASEPFIQSLPNLGIQTIRFDALASFNWEKLSGFIVNKPREASYERHSTETSISLYLNLDDPSHFEIDTGINFLNHLLEQVSKHSGIGMKLKVNGDLHIDDHHTVEDIGIVLGNAIREALGDKFGINRFGFVLPLDEARGLVTIDISNRPCCVYKADFKTEMIGDLSTQMVGHFFHSLADGLRASIHVEIEGENSHHMAESSFKALGCSLKQALKKEGEGIPSTKGIL